MELFSEVYSCYFTVVARLLEEARDGLSKAEIEQLVSSYGFYDSTFHLLPLLLNGEWDLLEEVDKIYYSKLPDIKKRPLTSLEKSWIAALLKDSRIKLFLDENQRIELADILSDVTPLFEQKDFHVYDQHADGDDYNNPGYIARFQDILIGIKQQQILYIEYDSGKGIQLKKQYHPYQLIYSARDNKFRLQCATFDEEKKLFHQFTLNLGRIIKVQRLDETFCKEADFSALPTNTTCQEPIVLEILQERNALERVMLQFASFRKQTEYDHVRDIYVCRIWFDLADETELLIRVLSFGPVVKVLGPEGFLKQVKGRIGRQIRLIC